MGRWTEEEIYLDKENGTLIGDKWYVVSRGGLAHRMHVDINISLSL